MQGKKTPNIVSIYENIFQAKKKNKKTTGTSMGKANYRISYFMGEWKDFEICQPFLGQRERAAEKPAVVIPDIFLSDQ